MAVDKETGLTDKQLKFCDEYMLDFNATRAAIAAGHSPKTAFAIGAENLKKPKIKERIEFLKTDLQRLSGVTALRNIEELKKIAYSTIAHLHKTWIVREDFEKLTEDQKASIQSIDTKVVKKNIGTATKPDMVDVEYVKITLYDKQKALDSLNKMLGLNSPEKVELSGEVVTMTPEEREKRIQDLLQKASK